MDIKTIFRPEKNAIVRIAGKINRTECVESREKDEKVMLIHELSGKIAGNASKMSQTEA